MGSEGYSPNLENRQSFQGEMGLKPRPHIFGVSSVSARLLGETQAPLSAACLHFPRCSRLGGDYERGSVDRWLPWMGFEHAQVPKFLLKQIWESLH